MDCPTAFFVIVFMPNTVYLRAYWSLNEAFDYARQLINAWKEALGRHKNFNPHATTTPASSWNALEQDSNDKHLVYVHRYQMPSP